MRLSEMELGTPHGAMSPLPHEWIWLLLGYRDDTEQARELAGAVHRLSIHTDGELPIALVSALGSNGTLRLMSDLGLTIPAYLDDAVSPQLGSIAADGSAFVAVVRNDRVIATASAGDPEGLISVASLALNSCGIDYIDPSRNFSSLPTEYHPTWQAA